MKKIFLALGLLFIAGNIQSQNITDAYRYSSEELNGTARYRAMSGAFGALGGDLSAISVNPASSAVFLKSFGTITLANRSTDKLVDYFGTGTSNENSDFNFNQAGGVLIFDTRSDSPWRKFSLGINYEQTNNFDDAYVATGISQTSIDSYFLNYANGIPLDLLQTREDESISDLYAYLGENHGYGAQQAFLGYQAYIIDQDDNSLENTSYNSFIGPGNFNQEYRKVATGLNGKFSFNFGTQYKDFLYLGANLNTHFLNYDRSTRFRETNNNAGSATNDVRFNNNLSTVGDGFSFQLGAIAKVSQRFRVGASYQSPTWFNITEEATQYLETNNNANERVIVDPNVLNIYPDYTLKTPGKLTGSLAVIIGTKGLISFDYSYKDYSATEFRPTDDPELQLQNELISEELQAVTTFRLGGEYRINNWSLRGGYRLEQSPYANETTVGDLTGYSGGVGYDFGSMKIDLAYTNAQYEENPRLYENGLTNTANIDRDLSNVILSLSFGL
ncbi:Outer membrane protein transport protein (OMPP1/FadL/TodX) [Salegentibacter holothuriorum]|uniref:Outer membrane protein transport protein (OMPP1/FadL/TodX) n=1 Tax=Salegentibacter holothuriorum TaxID=241145 RepID=A0A1T5D4C7_9FLAO|nr:outer membrane protein transport protein [Salegentibacter holothuriorum]SKB66467.1 Outer membrane protein transport protein (OMPP1/FadL/TodX) [Salegentibacter holothuriorum]